MILFIREMFYFNMDNVIMLFIEVLYSVFFIEYSLIINNFFNNDNDNVNI